jgi:acetyl-CoA acetyltransferase
MCCVITDGGGAVVLAEQRIASDTPDPIRILGAGESVAHRDTTSSLNFTDSAVAASTRAAFGQAGVTPGEVDLCTIYDSFTITVITALEDAGFCGKGEGGPFVQEAGLGPGSRLPVNPDGGGLATNHPGMRGIFLVIELVRQLRGVCGPRQIPGASLGAAIGVGGTLDSRHAAATLVLAQS